MECSTSYGSMKSRTIIQRAAHSLSVPRSKLLRRERRASNLLRRSVGRALSGEPKTPLPLRF